MLLLFTSATLAFTPAARVAHSRQRSHEQGRNGCCAKASDTIGGAAPSNSPWARNAGGATLWKRNKVGATQWKSGGDFDGGPRGGSRAGVNGPTIASLLKEARGQRGARTRKSLFDNIPPPTPPQPQPAPLAKPVLHNYPDVPVSAAAATTYCNFDAVRDTVGESRTRMEDFGANAQYVTDQAAATEAPGKWAGQSAGGSQWRSGDQPWGKGKGKWGRGA